jgi:hypothetical protein
MRVPSIVGAIGAIVLAAALGCGPKTVAIPPGSTDEACSTLKPQGDPVDTITVALFDVDSLLLERATHDSPVIRFVDTRGTDARDWLDQEDPSIDLLVLADRATIDYAVSLGRYQEVPLVPARGYLLLSVTRALALASGDSLADLSDGVRESLAREAVRGHYAEPLSSAEWAGDRMVGVEGIWIAEASGSQRVLYDENDSTARDLAERIVALMTGDAASSIAFANVVPHPSGVGSPFVAAGVSSDEFAKRLDAGDEFAYVVSVSLDPVGADVLRLALSAFWLNGSPDWPRKTVIPLVKTRHVAFAAKRPTGFGFDLRLAAHGGIRICRGTR